jgi:HEPN domain-containing protein
LAYLVHAGLSGEYVVKLKRRALGFLKAVDQVDDADLAAFFVEQAMQLYIKAVLYELFGERFRGHGLRELLGFLAQYLRKSGYEEQSERIRRFVDEYRAELALAEEAYIGGRYGEVDYDQKDVEALVKVADELIRLLDEVVKDVKLG